MSIGKDGSQRPVPTLTEVVQLPSEAAGAGRNPTNPVVTPTFRQVSRDDTKHAGADVGRNRLSTSLPPPTLPPVLSPGNLPVASSPIAMQTAVFGSMVAKPVSLDTATVVRERAVSSEPRAPVLADTADWPDLSMPASLPEPLDEPLPEPLDELRVELLDQPPREPLREPLDPPSDEPPDSIPLDDSVLPALLAVPADTPQAAVSLAAPAAFDEASLVERVLADLQQHVDLALEYRLREALQPALERVMQALLAQTRESLGRTLREVVARSVAHELDRARSRQD